jgi:hypothetical protein
MLSVMADSLTVTGVGPPGTFTYRDDDWVNIRVVLARVDIDADAVMVGDRWWAQIDPAMALLAAPQRPLREQLQELASDYRQLRDWRGLTPKQEAAQIQTVLNAMVRARTLLDSSKVGFVARGWDNLHEALDAFIAKAGRYVAGLKAMRSRSNANARKAHIVYWGELVELWQAITANRRSPIRFLYRCSEPAFPKETTENGIRNFLHRLSQTST